MAIHGMTKPCIVRAGRARYTLPIRKYIQLSVLVYHLTLGDIKMENIAKFDLDAVNNAVAEFVPACIVVSGKTLTEKKLSVVSQASSAALAYAVNQKGKVKKYACEAMAVASESMIAKHARGGNYKPLADAIAMVTGASLSIRNRAEFETLAGRFEDQLIDLKNGGYVVCKKTGMDKPSAKRNTLMQVIALIKEVQSIAAAM
jgi:RNA polymerase-binding transcription factor DksA